MPPQARKAADGYIVVVDMLILKTGDKRDEVVRVAKGRKVNPDPKYNDIDWLLSVKAIAPNDGTPKVRTNARTLTSAAGAPDDPVPVPDAGFLSGPPEAVDRSDEPTDQDEPTADQTGNTGSQPGAAEGE